MPRDIKCFVIMPFSETTSKHTEEYWTTLFGTFLKPLIEENPRIEALRSSVRREDLLGEILKNLVTQPIVVADLTDHNPNVFWELGVRQSFKHGTITIAENGTRLPFDLGKKGTLFYVNDILKNEVFRASFRSAIQDCIDSPSRPDSIVLDTIGGRGSLYEVIRADEANRRLVALHEELEFNQEILSAMINHVRANIEIRKSKGDKQVEDKKPEYTIARFSTICVELIIANRYLDIAKDFYDHASMYLFWLCSLNDQLQIWESQPSSTERFLEKNYPLAENSVRNFGEPLGTLIKERGLK